MSCTALRKRQMGWGKDLEGGRGTGETFPSPNLRPPAFVMVCYTSDDEQHQRVMRQPLSRLEELMYSKADPNCRVHTSGAA